MYSIYADDLLIYSDITPAEEVKVIDPRLTLEDSAAGSLEMTLPPINVGYSVIQRMNTDIIVKCEDEEIWRGRVLQDGYDFWNNRKLLCEGELAFLNDTHQPPHQYKTADGTTIRSFLQALINNHNARVGSNRRFALGMVTVSDGDKLEDSDGIYRYTNYESTLECINDKLVNRLKGHIRVRHQNNVRYLDYISDAYIGSNSQIIRFGVNLADFAKNFDMSELATVIIPRGCRLDEEEIPGLEPYLTVKDVPTKTESDGIWHTSGEIYVKSPTAVTNYGWVEVVVDWPDVEDATTLYKKAKKYLEDEQFDKMTLEIKALDLHYLSNNNQRIKMLDKLRCISTPHGMDHTFPITKMEIMLDRPDNSLYTLGTDVNLTLTKANNKVNQGILDRIEELPTQNEILDAARRNAFQILMGAEGGYVRFDMNNNDIITAIIISDGPTDDTSLNKWIWNINGLGHLHRSTYQAAWVPTYIDGQGQLDVAITMDGHIVANAITTGTLVAKNKKYELNMETGYLKMGQGQIMGNLEITNNGSLGVLGSSSRPRSAWIQNGGFEFCVPSARDPENSWGGLAFGIPSFNRRHWGNTSCVLWDAIEEADGYQQGGFFVVHGAPSQSASSYTKQTFTKFEIVEEGEGVARFDRERFEYWNGLSDRRVKKKIENIDLNISIKLILNLRPVSYNFNNLSVQDSDYRHAGFIAQEVQEIVEEDDGIVEYEEENDRYYLRYNEIIPHLVNVVQQQQKEIEELKAIVKTLQNK